MDDFSITRPEPATPTRDSGGHAPRGEARERRRPPRENSEPVAPEKPEASGDEETDHQIDELA